MVEKPLTIIIGADMFPPEINGAARFAERLAGGLVRRGHNVHIVAPAADNNHGTFTEVHDGVDIVVHRIKSYRWYPHESFRFSMPFGLTRKMRAIVDEVKPDVVHIQSHFIMGRALAEICREDGIRFIGTNHFMPENIARFSLIPSPLLGPAAHLAWKDFRHVYRGCFAITTPTQKAADLLESAAGVTGVIPISCGLDCSEFAVERKPVEQLDNRIVYVGRLNPEKRIDVLLRAVALLPAELDARVDLVGDGDQREPLGQLAEDLGIRANVRFLGHVSDAEMTDTLAQAKVFAMPSIAELQSIATMEAMASGLPVVAANAMALPHLCRDGANGYLFEPDDPQALAERLRLVLTAGPSEWLRMSENSHRIVAAHDINRTVETFEMLYRGEAVTAPSMEVEIIPAASEDPSR